MLLMTPRNPAKAERDIELSCVLLTWNSQRYLANCLASVFKDLEASGIRHQVIVVDNGSTDDSVRILAAHARPNLQVIQLGRNTGTTFSRNIALRMALGSRVAILDSDIEITEPGTFRALLDFLDANPDVGLVAPRLRFPSGRFQMTVDEFPTLQRKVQRFLNLRALELKAGREQPQLPSMDVDYAISAFWCLPATAIDQVGLLDEEYFYAPEDVDYCIRIGLGGWRVTYVPTVVAVHHAQEISRRRPFTRAFREHLKGLVRLYGKFGIAWSADVLRRRIADAYVRRDARTTSPTHHR